MKSKFKYIFFGLMCMGLSVVVFDVGGLFSDLMEVLGIGGGLASGVKIGGLLTAGRTVDCTTACSGGVEKYWLANEGDIATVTENATGVTAITMVATKVFYEIEFAEETGQFVESVTLTNCAQVVDQSLVSVWRCRDQNDRNVIDAIGGNCCGMVCIHLEATGLTWIWGHNAKQRVRLRTANGDSGTTFDSENIETVTLGARAKQKAVVFVPGEVGVPV